MHIDTLLKYNFLRWILRSASNESKNEKVFIIINWNFLPNNTKFSGAPQKSYIFKVNENFHPKRSKHTKKSNSWKNVALFVPFICHILAFTVKVATLVALI